jgi:DNA replication protein DnaC
VLSLATCHWIWIKAHHNVIITGGTGIGKSYLGEAFADKACREGFTAIRYGQGELFEALNVANGIGALSKFRQKLAKTDLLVVDDLVLVPLSEDQRRDFLDIMEDLHGIRSTLFTSQYPITTWHAHIGDPTIADAILDRIVHNAHKINLQGDSMRKLLLNITDTEPEP